MRQSQDRMRRYRQLLPFVVATRQPVGLPALLSLAEILRPLRLSDADAALAVALIGSTNVGQAFYGTNRAPVAETVKALTEALEPRAESERAALGPLLAFLPAADDRLYEAVLDQVVAAIERLAGDSGH
jgi:TetR/AcrR family tetracycline transcriptional repressor